MIVLLVIILIVFFLPPFLMWLLQHMVRRRIKKNMENVFGNFGNYGGRANENAPTPEPPKPAKKISRDIGEYVKFEEIDTTVDVKDTKFDDGSEEIEITYEEQIIDVEWEDIDDDDC